MADNSILDRNSCNSEGAPALPSLPRGVALGALVAVRGRRWRVSTLIEHDDCRELHLLDGDGSARVLLWPFDRPSTITTTRQLRVVPLPAWSAAVDRVVALDLDPRTPRAAFSGRILSYQLEPAIAVASGVARVLLADEVGLGKTIQAGWIAADLLAREPEARVLIAVPASLSEQWAGELARFFSLSPARVDAGWLRAAVADRPADVSPWAAPGIYLGSIDFLKRPDVAASLPQVTWDLLVIDEAHGAAAPTERHAALARVAAVSRRVVAITATPYSGDPAAFASMAALGAAAGEPGPLLFRRSRAEVGDTRRRRHRFALVRTTPVESSLQRLLARYTREVWRHAPGDVENARLAMTILCKRALSSPAAVRRSLERRLDLLRGAVPAPRQLSLFEETPESDEALPDAALATPGLADGDLEIGWLTALLEAAIAAAATDSKQRHLLRLLARARGESVVVFTEYRDTLRQLAAALPQALQLHGGLAPRERSDVQRRFNRRGGILLATDAAAEGLNLQQRCRLVVNYELPWNPARLEQRIGRVDRIGQQRAVHAISLVARDTAEDLVVARLARRLARVAATLGERDRLAALLSDARTARAVIGGSTILDDGEPATPPSLPRPVAGEFPSDRSAAEIAQRQRGGWSGVTAIASLRARQPLQPGHVVVVRASAVTDRQLVAERSLLLHVRKRAPQPGSAAAAQAAASATIAAVDRLAPSLAVLRDWLAAATALHQSAVRAWIAREEALSSRDDGRRALQPGLFDRRALEAADRTTQVDRRRGSEHERRLTALHAALDVRLECAVEAVLIVWP